MLPPPWQPVLDPSLQDHPTSGPIVYVVTNAVLAPLGEPAQVVKIGTTVDLPGRMMRWHTRRGGPGVNLRLLVWREGGEAVERELHRRFRLSRVSGSDWYWVTDDLDRELRGSAWR